MSQIYKYYLKEVSTFLIIRESKIKKKKTYKKKNIKFIFMLEKCLN